MKRFYCIILFTFISLFQSMAQEVSIATNTHFVVKGDVKLIMKNVKFENNGVYHTADETVTFTGGSSSDTASISGSSVTKFHNLEVNKNAFGLRLDQAISVDSLVKLTSGTINLNGHDLTLKEDGSIQNETSVNRIWGESGEIVMNLNVNAPTNWMPGNMGVSITSTANFGVTTVKRGHKPPTSYDSHGIARYFDISTTQKTGLDATLRFYYEDSELEGIDEAELDMWRNGGDGWERRYVGNTASERDTSNNYLEERGIDAFSIWTLGGTVSNILPIELLSFDAYLLGKHVVLDWITLSELNNDRFEIEHSVDSKKWIKIGEVKGIKKSFEKVQYSFVHQQPSIGTNYYRLKQIDIDGTVNYTSIQSVDLSNANLVTIYPNPCTDILKINSDWENINISITDIRGVKLLDLQNYQKGEILEISSLPQGVYYIFIFSESQTYSQLFEKL